MYCGRDRPGDDGNFTCFQNYLTELFGETLLLHNQILVRGKSKKLEGHAGNHHREEDMFSASENMSEKRVRERVFVFYWRHFLSVKLIDFLSELI